MEFKDYYKILGVEKNASAEDIKKSYRKLAMQFHPDTNKNGKDTDSKFKEINEAYEVLGDTDKRNKYDRLGSSWNQYSQSGGSSSDFNWSEWYARNQQSGKRRKAGSFSNFGDFFDTGGSVSDFFDKIFGENYQQKQNFKNAPKKGDDLETEVEITMEEAFKGATRKLTINDEKIEVKIKPGIADGQILKVSNKGLQGKYNGSNGDLLIKIVILPNKRAERKGDDLHIEFPIDLYKAILGGKAKITSFGGTIQLSIPPETESGKILKLKGQGMPIYNAQGERGDLYVKLSVSLPKKLSVEEIELFKQLQALRNI